MDFSVVHRCSMTDRPHEVLENSNHRQQFYVQKDKTNPEKQKKSKTVAICLLLTELPIFF